MLAVLGFAMACLLVAVSPSSAQPAPPEPTPRFEWGDHPTVHFGNDTRLEFRGELQGDARSSDGPLDDDTRVGFPRERLALRGEVAGFIAFQVERELGDGGQWEDLFVTVQALDAAQFDAGQFKLPFSLERTTSGARLDFIYRSRAASLLAPGRDRGLMAHGRLFDRIVRYELGLFEHDGRSARGGPTRVFGAQTVAGRLRVSPFDNLDSVLRTLDTGAAFTTSDVPDGFSGILGYTVHRALFYPNEYWVKGRRQRLGLEARWRPGNFGVTSEYIRLTDERRDQSIAGTDLSPLVATGWYVAGTWVLTGEPTTRGPERPRRPFLQGGVGAIETAVRVERLSFGSDASGQAPSDNPRAAVVLRNSDQVETFGVNWYLNRWIKVQVNFIRETIADPARNALPSGAFWSRALRVQVAI